MTPPDGTSNRGPLPGGALPETMGTLSAPTPDPICDRCGQAKSHHNDTLLFCPFYSTFRAGVPPRDAPSAGDWNGAADFLEEQSKGLLPTSKPGYEAAAILLRNEAALRARLPEGPPGPCWACDDTGVMEWAGVEVECAYCQERRQRGAAPGEPDARQSAIRQARMSVDTAVEIIEAVDQRAMACDGPVTPTLKEMRQEEMGDIYEALMLAKSHLGPLRGAGAPPDKEEKGDD